MINILGVDYGLRKIGVAYGDSVSRLAEPLTVLKVTSIDDAIEKVRKIVESEKIEKIVIGLSENEMAEKSKEFGDLLQAKCSIEVEFQDETLSTQDAQTRSRAAGVPQKKRKKLEDAYAACIILQEYFDTSG